MKCLESQYGDSLGVKICNSRFENLHVVGNHGLKMENSFGALSNAMIVMRGSLNDIRANVGRH